jgi:hypothetical protein
MQTKRESNVKRTRSFDLAAAGVARPLKLLPAFELARTLGWVSLCAALAWQGEWVLTIGCGVTTIVGLWTMRPRQNA